MPTRSRSRSKSKTKKSSLVLFEPKRGSEYEFTFIINLTAELVDQILEAAEEAEEDEYGALVKLGGAVYDNEGKLRGSIYLRDDEDEPKRKRSSSKRRSREDDDDEESSSRTKRSSAARSSAKRRSSSNRRSREEYMD